MREFKEVTIQAAIAVSATKTLAGSKIDVANYDTMVVFLKYAKGSETGVIVTPQYLIATSGSDEYPQMEWSNANDAERSAKRYKLTASANGYIVLDVRAFSFIKIYQEKSGGTANGTLKVDALLLRDS